MDKVDYIRTKERLEYLKKEFSDHVLNTQEAIRAIEKRSIIRNEQMISLDTKLDDVIGTLADSKLSVRKGIITQTIENTNNLSKIQNEMAAWKRASVIVGGLIGGALLLVRYLFVLLKQMINEN